MSVKVYKFEYEILSNGGMSTGEGDFVSKEDFDAEKKRTEALVNEMHGCPKCGEQFTYLSSNKTYKTQLEAQLTASESKVRELEKMLPGLVKREDYDQERQARIEAEKQVAEWKGHYKVKNELCEYVVNELAVAEARLDRLNSDVFEEILMDIGIDHPNTIADAKRMLVTKLIAITTIAEEGK